MDRKQPTRDEIEEFFKELTNTTPVFEDVVPQKLIDISGNEILNSLSRIGDTLERIAIAFEALNIPDGKVITEEKSAFSAYLEEEEK